MHTLWGSPLVAYAICCLNNFGESVPSVTKLPMNFSYAYAKRVMQSVL